MGRSRTFAVARSRRAVAVCGSAEQLIEYQQHGADADRGVGDIEGRPVETGGVPLNEVDHGAEAQAVDDVAESAAEDQGERQRDPEFTAVPRQGADDPRRDGQREKREEPTLPAAGIGEETECGAGIEGLYPAASHSSRITCSRAGVG